jgi:hypothetical protein
VTQLEFDDLMTMARGWKLRAMVSADESEKRILNSNADELMSALRHADTSPGDAPEGEPDALPPLPPNDRLPRIEE